MAAVSQARGTTIWWTQNKALTPVCEYYGVMIAQAPQTDKIAGDDIFRGYSIARRDKAPLIETEDFRDEAGRNVWDDYSPPHFGFKPHLATGPGRPSSPGAAPNPGGTPNPSNSPSPGSRRAPAVLPPSAVTPTIGIPKRSASPPPRATTQYIVNRIDNPNPAHSKWSAYASIYFSDSDADGARGSSQVLRVSGKVDGVRLPKELFFVSRVMQSEKPDLHIIGHWTYPMNTTKTVYVAATLCDQVELFLNGKSLGVANQTDRFRGYFL